MLTVKETLELACELQPEAAPQPMEGESEAPTLAAPARVDDWLRLLGLWDVRHSRVGDQIHRGISGGERRRLAVGCELIGSPALLVADEPTTGCCPTRPPWDASSQCDLQRPAAWLDAPRRDAFRCSPESATPFDPPQRARRLSMLPRERDAFRCPQRRAPVRLRRAGSTHTPPVASSRCCALWCVAHGFSQRVELEPLRAKAPKRSKRLRKAPQRWQAQRRQAQRWQPHGIGRECAQTRLLED